MNLKRNRLLIVGGTLCGVLLVEMVLLAWSGSALRRERRILEANHQRLVELHTRNPFPSMENVKRLQGDLDRFKAQVDELISELARDPFPRRSLDAADFSSRAQTMIERFRRRAERVGVEISPTLEAGFAYYTRGGAIPEARHVPRLSRQLHSVRRVVEVLLRSEVDSINAISRKEFETRTVSATPVERRRSRRVAVRAGAMNTPLSGGGNTYGFFSIERIGVSFTANEEIVWKVLDSFASAAHFMVVAEFSHASETTILSFNPEAIKSGVSDDETMRYLSEGILVGKTALSRPERIIAGRETVRVDLLVDVYDFVPQEGGQ